MQDIEIFRAGSHTAIDGNEYNFTTADIVAMAEGYDRTRHDAPLVIGHPSMDAPAWGWVEGLRAEGDLLLARPVDADPAFAEMVKAKRFKFVSAALYKPDEAGNPNPGQWALRHVGFLGAHPPAVKGLKPVAFGAGAGFVAFMEPWQQGALGRLFRNLREWLIGTAGQEAADRVMPNYEIEAVAEPPPQPAVPAFAEPQKEPEKVTTAPDPAAAAALEAERARLAADQQAFAAERAAFAEERRASRAAEDATFVAGLVSEGRLSAGNRADALALLGSLPAEGEATVGFAEGGKRTPHAAFRELLGRMPTMVAFGQLTRPEDAPLADAGNFEDIVEKATAFAEVQRQKGIVLTVDQAVRAVTEGGAA